MSGVAARGVLVEILVDDLDGAQTADRGGAARIELCANVLEGGTTPSLGLIRSVLRSVDQVGVQVMVRPRGGDFVYDDGELDVMCDDLAAIADAAPGARTQVGVVTGSLTSANEIDRVALQRLVEAAHPLPVTFHKAFDATRDLLAAYEVLREVGVERVLTSGGPGTALEGVHVLAELVRRSEVGGPIVLVGGSVRPANVRSILAATGAQEVHMRLQSSSPRADGTLRTDAAHIANLFAALNDGSVVTRRRA